MKNMPVFDTCGFLSASASMLPRNKTNFKQFCKQMRHILIITADFFLMNSTEKSSSDNDNTSHLLCGEICFKYRNKIFSYVRRKNRHPTPRCCKHSLRFTFIASTG